MRISLDELLAKKEAGEISPPRQDAKPVDLPEDFWKDAKVVHPEKE